MDGSIADVGAGRGTVVAPWNGGAGQDPIEVLIFVVRHMKRKTGGVRAGGRHCAGKLPVAGFRMAVGEEEVRGAGVVGGGQVDPFVTAVAVEEVAVVDAVGMLLDDREDLEGGGVVRELDELVLAGVVGIDGACE
jgi:hypothetical protein